jgi:hypothetical protein
VVKNRGGKVPTGDVGKLAPPHDWRDDLSWGYGRIVREIEGRWLWAGSYSDAEAARDVAALVAILGVVQRELDETRASVHQLWGCRTEFGLLCPACYGVKGQ